MSSNIYQLEPTVDTFHNLIFRRLIAIDVVIICEGITDKKVVKKIMSISEINNNVRIGIVNVGGLRLAYNYTVITASLASVARRLRAIGMLIDAENFTPNRRVESLLDSLRARGLIINTPPFVEGQTYKVSVETTGRRVIDLVVAVSGDFDLPFETHKLEDHAVRLLIMEGAISEREVRNFKDAKEIVSEKRLLELLDNSHIDNIRSAFRHIYTMLKMLGVLSTSS